MRLVDILFMEPAPIDGRFVRRESPLGPWPTSDTIPRVIYDADYYAKAREKRIAYCREWRKRRKAA